MSATLHVVGVYFLALSVVSAALGIWSWYDANREAYRQNKHHAQAEQRQSAERIANECAIPLAPAHFVAECLADTVETYEKEKNTNADLEAQVDMAFWAKAMFFATVGSLVISIGGLIMLFASLRQTRRAISDTREIGEKEIRAYLAIEPLDASVFVGKPLTGHFKITNTGNTPARRVHHVAMLDVLDYPLTPTQGDLVVASDDEIIPFSSLASGADYIGDVHGDGDKLTEDVLNQCITGTEKRIYMTGSVFYEDIFSHSRKTRFCATAVLTRVAHKTTGGKGIKLEWELAHVLNDET